MTNPIEDIVSRVVSKLLHQAFIDARRVKVLVELRLLAADDADRKAGYEAAIAAIEQ